MNGRASPLPGWAFVCGTSPDIVDIGATMYRGPGWMRCQRQQPEILDPTLGLAGLNPTLERLQQLECRSFEEDMDMP
jgi:hypothetical protein